MVVDAGIADKTAKIGKIELAEEHQQLIGGEIRLFDGFAFHFGYDEFHTILLWAAIAKLEVFSVFGVFSNGSHGGDQCLAHTVICAFFSLLVVVSEINRLRSTVDSWFKCQIRGPTGREEW